MSFNNVPSAPRTLEARPEYSAGFSGRHGASVPSSRRLRLVYFAAASLWGFCAGVAGLLAGLTAAGNPASTDLTSIAALVPAAGIAIVGAGVVAGAYHEARRRRR